MSNDGATQVPVYAQESKEICIHEPNNPLSRKGPHNYRWLWINGICTNRLKCSTCGHEKEVHK